jgi:hypothetical protein
MFAERFKESVIEERKKSVEEMLHFVSNSPHLINSAPLKHFITVSRGVRGKEGERRGEGREVGRE